MEEMLLAAHRILFCRYKGTLAKCRGRIPLDRRERATAKSGSPHKPGGSFEWTLRTQYHYNVQPPGYVDKTLNRFVFVREMVPELMVPDLSDFPLKPYVAYNVKEITNDKTLPKDIFNACYAKTIVDEFIKAE
ncbi:hypothetical protein GJ496_000598 [Pomphorhynchus laevis]|nr:hypothetical protein GJ496_000598 [Pomphorhynchus laevis]